VLAAWRKTETYKAALYQYRSAVSFSYIEETANMEDAADLARSFIYVNINVLGDANKAFAEDLMARIQVQVPDYVSENMIVPSGYSGTRCIEITTTSGIALTNPSYMKDSIIKFALLGGIALFVLACVALVIIDSSDKRVRSYEQIDRYLKVPLLGIIPSIDEEKINAWNENMKNGKGEEQL
jgi:capsular polysaccharide biosynthesis protein